MDRIAAVEGTAIPLRGGNIDTDRIIPARFLRAITFEGLERHLFEDDRAQAGDHPFANPAHAGATILLVNANFGCGSSREHAPQAIRRWGIRAVVGESFSEIFFGNSVALGMPCLTAARAVIEELMQQAERDPRRELRLSLDALHVVSGDRSFALTMPAAARQSFLDGTWDATALLLDKYDEVESVARRLPYLRGWS
ncbi:MAG: 3-isopropylmalate dehydratase small subunit [Acidobacteria bacterium RIFCSPLOWO2_02_FULL_67_36]|nr:MAG: 3-isopropylmalate dehydratase small subunit [Acidobacteria bacterium RIFCSPLOWO2_02_FULL_67_36]OFW22989.1 MAG: 3-isopropylmalate dehydratase small subunit [Acidobacteria bacterium RIFCSPLOWO2_12_FULL_66_21]